MSTSLKSPAVTVPGGTRQTSSITGAQAVAQVIAAQPDPAVFGMPGGHTVQIYDALYRLQDRVSVSLTRQESIATVMAEARGRLTGRPAFVIGQGAWVLGNASIGTMEAHLGASPMVLLVDATDGGSFSHHGPYQAGFGGHGAYDLAAALRAITKQTFVALDATQALQMTQLAVKHATTGEPGPVAVVFHSGALFGRIETGSQPPAYLGWTDSTSLPPRAGDAELDAAAAVISEAERPVIVAGNGVRLAGAESALASLARALDIPVATTPAGKGVFPEDDEHAVGIIGSFGHDTANGVVGQADVIIAVGTKLGASDTANAHPDLISLDRQRLVHIDIEPLNVSWTWPSEAPVIGDAAHALAGLLDRLRECGFDGARRVAHARQGAEYFPAPRRDQSVLSGRDVVRVLSARLERETVLTCDAGENRLFVMRDFQSKSGGTVLQPNGGGGMGYAVPAAMAAAATFPGRPAVAVCGDGGFSMSLTALMSAIELDLDITVVVLNNRMLGWVYNGQRGRVIASALHDFDYAAVGRSMGAWTSSVDSVEGFEQALEGALVHRGLSIIVSATSSQDRYQDLMSSLNNQDVYAVTGDD